MPVYEIEFTATIWLDKRIEAESEEKAKEKFHADFPDEAYEYFESDMVTLDVTEVKEE